MRKERLNLSEATLVSGWARIWTQVWLSTKPAASPILNEQVASGVSIPLGEQQRLWEVPCLALTITPGRPTIRHTPRCRFSGNFTGHVQSAAHDSSGWIWGWRWGRLWGCCRQFTVTEVCKEPGPAHLHSWCWKIMRTLCQCWPAATFLAEILGGSPSLKGGKNKLCCELDGERSPGCWLALCHRPDTWRGTERLSRYHHSPSPALRVPQRER